MKLRANLADFQGNWQVVNLIQRQCNVVGRRTAKTGAYDIKIAVRSSTLRLDRDEQ